MTFKEWFEANIHKYVQADYAKSDYEQVASAAWDAARAGTPLDSNIEVVGLFEKLGGEWREVTDRQATEPGSTARFFYQEHSSQGPQEDKA